jgi:hypothetical protein
MALNTTATDEKNMGADMVTTGSPTNGTTLMYTDTEKDLESREVFQKGVDSVEFRTVSWQRATIVFCKINFAMSILAIPEAFAALGYIGGSLSIIGFTSLNTCELISPASRL